MPEPGHQTALGTWHHTAHHGKPGERRVFSLQNAGSGPRGGTAAFVATSVPTSGSVASTTTSLAPSTSTTSSTSPDTTTTTALTTTTAITTTTTLTTTATTTSTVMTTTAATTTTTTTTTTIFGQQSPDAVGVTFFSLAFVAILAVCLCFYAFCHPMIWARRPRGVRPVGRQRLQPMLREEETGSYHALAEQTPASDASSADPQDAISPSGRQGASSRDIVRSSTSAPLVERQRVTLEMVERGQSGMS
mmetsp:Transcript_1919/g.3756  ORF Transcript_1919/g.3756 Transcript_1919/m.3756 type:complete len:248 (+) Transcript_1919:38-781(+)|eukprot:CAMPEP_0204329206 /NCGR_PEP_ID=MMETSP0469-20131031/13983_1 /ASSEMBLY_ACC=CAM_ASM_000384 /TAXON_ID=2969 /ORGANISM="Oxyrrhis marina" /LENGTH=247 /DNA_ID=CAMNT_0051311775 /DNA_START=8 /DNA_END=751 /DNA_ORIENTATION=-